MFVPSGTMGNQIGVRLHCSPGDEFLCDYQCHVFRYEQGAYAQLFGIAVQPIETEDCLLSVEEPPAFRKGQVHRLFPDFGAAERAHFQRTGLYPIMHCVLVRRALTESEPWLLGFLQKAFEAAKAEALDWLLDMDASSLPLPFQHSWANEVRELLGENPWPYGIADNRAVLAVFGGLMFEQGLTSRALTPEEVFPTG